MKVYHGLAESFEMKCKHAGPETTTRWRTWDVVFVSTADGVEVHGDPLTSISHCVEDGDMCKPMGSPHDVDGKVSGCF